MIDLPPRLSLARLPTPLQLLQRLSERVGRRIWIKRDDLTGAADAGNKIRKLEFTLAAARAAGAEVLITCGGLQSNHCRATALLGARLGFRVHLLLRGECPEQSEGNLLLDRMAGAQCSFFSPRYYNANFEFIRSRVEAQYREAGQSTWFIPTGASDAIGVWGYVNAAAELAEQIELQGIKASGIWHATGSGGTQAGLTAGGALAGLPPVTGFAVCDDAGYFQRKVRADLDDWKHRYDIDIDVDALDVRVNDGYIGPGYARATPELFATIETVLRLEGIALDPVYSGKAMHGLLSEVAANRIEGDDLVFVHTGGFPGLLAQHAEYAEMRA